MIVSRRWLEALLDRPLDARDTAERLTMHVAPVDAVVPLHQDLGDIVVARVLEVKQHPNADRLTLCLVDAGGAGGPVAVVCGARNVQAGKSYPYAPVGALLPGGVRLERKPIRGVESNGMLCSAKELGLGDDHAGILELDRAARSSCRRSRVLGARLRPAGTLPSAAVAALPAPGVTCPRGPPSPAWPPARAGASPRAS